MKYIYKISLLLIITAVMLSCLAPCAFAADGEYNVDATAVDVTEQSVGENIFETAYKTIMENSAELTSLLGLIASVILMLGYKRTLLPTIKGGISLIGKKVTQIEGTSKESTEQASALSDLITAKLASYELTLEAMNELIAAMEARTARAELEAKSRGEIFGLIEIECELLYTIFMNSSLPQYEKERVGEHISKMREMLGASARANQ